MVGADGEFGQQQVRALAFDCEKDGQELLLVGGQGSVARTQILTEECDGMMSLHQHSTDTNIKGVRFDNKRLRKIRQCKHWSRCQGLFERLKGFLMFASPDIWHSFLQQISQRSSYDPVMANEPA